MALEYDLLDGDGAQIIRENGRLVLQVIGHNSDDADRLTSQLNRVGALEDLIEQAQRLLAQASGPGAGGG